MAQRDLLRFAFVIVMLFVAFLTPKKACLVIESFEEFRAPIGSLCIEMHCLVNLALNVLTLK